MALRSDRVLPSPPRRSPRRSARPPVRAAPWTSSFASATRRSRRPLAPTSARPEHISPPPPRYPSPAPASGTCGPPRFCPASYRGPYFRGGGVMDAFADSPQHLPFPSERKPRLSVLRGPTGPPLHSLTSSPTALPLASTTWTISRTFRASSPLGGLCTCYRLTLAHSLTCFVSLLASRSHSPACSGHLSYSSDPSPSRKPPGRRTPFLCSPSPTELNPFLTENSADVFLTVSPARM